MFKLTNLTTLTKTYQGILKSMTRADILVKSSTFTA